MTESFTITRTLAAPPELVWDVWTKPEHFAVWFGTEAVEVPLDSVTPVSYTHLDVYKRQVIGILLGVALSDGLSLMLGKGLWQLVVVLLVVFVIGRALRSNPAFALAAATPSALVVILLIPEGGPFGRTVDAAIGGAVALLATALIPRDPQRAATRDRRILFSAIDQSMQSIIDLSLIHI